jgi:CMP-N,N'-diacetyllegionaminic acid synthase
MFDIAIIPARSGSKGVKGKNFRNFSCGKSLLDLAVDFCLLHNVAKQIVVTTDKRLKDLDYLNSRIDRVTYIQRSIRLSDDMARSHDVVIDVLQKIKKFSGIALLVQPTNPFRDISVCSNIYDHMLKKELDAVISVNKLSTYKILDKHGNQLVKTDGYTGRRQDSPDSYIPSGSFYAFRINESFVNGGKFVMTNATSFIQDSWLGQINIDNMHDFSEAKELYDKIYCKNK